MSDSPELQFQQHICDELLRRYKGDTLKYTALEQGEKVSLVGFGAFDVKERAARMGRNPRTKEEVEIPASRVPQFKAGKALKDAVAK